MLYLHRKAGEDGGELGRQGGEVFWPGGVILDDLDRHGGMFDVEVEVATEQGLKDGEWRGDCAWLAIARFLPVTMFWTSMLEPVELAMASTALPKWQAGLCAARD